MGLRSRLFLCSSIVTLVVILIVVASYFWFGINGNSHCAIMVPKTKTNTLSISTISYPTSKVESTTTASNTQNIFVTRSGSHLLLNGQPFRFSGANIPWLGLQDTNNTVYYPSHFTVDDALATASFMGATVVRSHTLGISVGCSICLEPSLNKWHNTAFNAIDYAIKSAHDHNIRLIIPLVDNWHYYPGGKHTFTDWEEDSDEDDFYSNAAVIQDFKNYISHILNHINRYTGIALRDDPTILAWETGNELLAPSDWVQAITVYIKEVDHHHLVMDGNQPDKLSSDLSIKTVDIYTAHYDSYPPPTIATLRTQVNQATNAGKVFIVGEYDWNTNKGDSLNDFLSFIEQSNLAGDMYWSLFPHGDKYGFVQHYEHYTLHYPGDTPDMQSRISLLRAHAYAMRGLSVPKDASPGTPYITAVNGKTIAWRGAFGAAMYTVERSTQGADGPWTVICDRCATDFSTPWTDASKPTGAIAYRVRAYSVTGIPGAYSNTFPVLVRICSE